MGAFESCPLQTMLPTCTQRLGVMHRGGLQVVVISIIGVTPAEAASYAAAARSRRMSVMWDIATPDWWQQALTTDAAAAAFPQFAADCGCADNAELLAYMAERLGSLGVPTVTTPPMIRCLRRRITLEWQPSSPR